MSVFYLACGALIALSALFVILPLRRPDAGDSEPGEANLEWYRLRQRELEAEGNEALAEDIKLRLLEDTSAGEEVAHAARTGFRSWILLPVIAVFSGAVYYFLGAAPDVLITRQLNGIGDATSPAELEGLVEALERRSQQRPDNLEYTALLGRYAMERQDYAGAAKFFDRLSEAAPGDATALAYAAQASYLAAGRSLNAAARLRAERALAINPHQRTALGLLGMASFEQGQYRAAINYWERLLAVEPPGSESARMIASVIDNARERLGEPAVAGDAPAVPSVPGAGVTVSVAAPAEGGVDPADTVFVLARDADGNSRMPIAVQRLTGADLPFTLRLDDSNSMAGQKLSAFASVVVQVQVSPEGRPGAANASWLGQAGPLAPEASGDPVEITLQRVPKS